MALLERGVLELMTQHLRHELSARPAPLPLIEQAEAGPSAGSSVQRATSYSSSRATIRSARSSSGSPDAMASL